MAKYLCCRPSASVPEGEHGVLTKSDSDAGKEADKRAKVEKAKSKGRFQIIENEEKARAPKSQVGGARLL